MFSVLFWFTSFLNGICKDSVDFPTDDDDATPSRQERRASENLNVESKEEKDDSTHEDQCSDGQYQAQMRHKIPCKERAVRVVGGRTSQDGDDATPSRQGRRAKEKKNVESKEEKDDSTHEDQCSKEEGKNRSVKSFRSVIPGDLNRSFSNEVNGSMVDSSAVPTAILPALTEVEKSVALLRCGNVTGTGFLLTKDKLITCHHVHNQIVAQRHPDAKILVHFGDPQQRQILQAEVDEEKRPIYGINLDYIIYWIKYTPAHLKPLGHLVRSSLPSSGRPVILIGHPESKSKVFEICPIKERWVETLVERTKDAHEYCQQHPQECKLSDENKSCVHSYEDRVLESYHRHQLAYDTNFLEGSSGSPVLSVDGYIVAMHTRGYPFSRGFERVSLMEFGTTFASIYQDVKDRYSSWLANLLFPNINS